MNDTTPKQLDKEALSISARKMTRFIDAKGLGRPCSDCGSEDWQLTLAPGYEDGDDDAKLQLAMLPGLGIPRSFPVHTLICVGCGTVKLISAVTVLDWLAENG